MDFDMKTIRERMKKNARRAISATAVLEVVILLVLVAYFLGAAFGGALTSIATTPLTSVNGSVVSLYQGVVPLFFVIGIILLVYFAVVKRGK